MKKSTLTKQLTSVKDTFGAFALTGQQAFQLKAGEGGDDDGHQDEGGGPIDPPTV